MEITVIADEKRSTVRFGSRHRVPSGSARYGRSLYRHGKWHARGGQHCGSSRQERNRRLQNPPMRNLGDEAVNFSRSVVPATTSIARAIFILNRENMGGDSVRRKLS